MILDFPIFLLGGVLMVSAADHVPTLDTRPTCADVESFLAAPGTVATCKQDEQQARDTLSAEWQNFPAADRSNCIAETSIGGFPSYVQVLTCLELARDARTMTKD